MSLAERTYICKTLLKKPGTKTSALQFELANRFGTTWDLSTIRLNRKAMGFNPAAAGAVRTRSACAAAEAGANSATIWAAAG